MKVETFDKLAGASILLSLLFTGYVGITSWNWFPTPGDWGDIAQIPKSITNYIALLLPPVTILTYLFVRRLYFKREF